jgi:O-acetyl-ADP-ribose deacetylase (regulator of RNase III)
MQEKARVVAIDGDIISVVPLEIEACINCNNTECKQNGNVFKAINRKGFDLYVGSQVRIAAPAGKQLVQGLVVIGVPVALAAAAFQLVASIAPSSGEGLRVGAALTVLALGAVAMTIMMKPGKAGLPEVLEIF